MPKPGQIPNATASKKRTVILSRRAAGVNYVTEPVCDPGLKLTR